MASERRDDYAGFSVWFVGLMRKRGYNVDGPRAGGQAKLSEDSGVSNTVISHMMNGRRIPDVQTMVKLGPYLGTTVREMLLHSGRVLEKDLVASTGDPLVDPMLDKIYSLDYLPMSVRKARAEDFLRRVADARRMAELEILEDARRYELDSGSGQGDGSAEVA
jgi:transcriptional regulator with XRE-family HTH domain